MKKNYVKKICICAMMAALFVPLELLASNFGKIVFLDNYQIPISCFPLILASIMFGVPWGAATAVIGSFLSQLAMGYGINWSTILWMLPTIVYGILVALLYKAFSKSDKFPALFINFFTSAVVLSTLNIGVNYISNYISGGKAVANFIAIFASLKIIGGIVFAIIFALIMPIIVKQMKRLIKL